MSKHHFYGHLIITEEEERKIRKLLEEFKGDLPNEALKEKIWEKLQKAKSEGTLSIPLKVVLRKATASSKSYVEVILDTKV